MTKNIDAWGDPRRHYAVTDPDEIGLRSNERWEDMVETVVPDCRGAVKRTVSQWNRKIRIQLSNEIGFQPKGHTIQVEVVDGLPAPFSAILDNASGLEALLLNQGQLKSVVAGTQFMASEREKVRSKDGKIAGPASPDEIENVRKTAEAWLKLASDNDLGKGLAEIDEDMLGAYYPYFNKVVIYWSAIGAYAALYDVPVEALTFVVLSHELAHAYTHVGLDIDGHFWPTKLFKSTDMAIVEGLAQFYTEAVCKSFAEKMPAAYTTFEGMMKQQHEIYRTHRQWIQEDDGHCGEVVRVSLVECRRSKKPMHPDDFAEILNKRRNEIAGLEGGASHTP